MSVLVITEQRDGKWHPMSWEALAAGQQIGSSLGVAVTAAVVGGDTESLAAELAATDLAGVVRVEHELLADYTPDGFSVALRQLIESSRPRWVLFPHTYQVRDFAPKLAASLDRPLVSDVIEPRAEEGELVLVRQVFQGKFHTAVSVTGDPPYFASLQSGAFRGDQVRASADLAPIEQVRVVIEASQIRTKTEEPFREAKTEVDLSGAEIIVSVGRGIRDAEHIELARKLAEALGAELGASRPICDSGWLPLERQVGSSGQTVSPKLYLAIGISGAIQHVVGMKGSQTIVAINKDETAPIFEMADYGIVGDLFEIVPALTDAVLESKQE